MRHRLPETAAVLKLHARYKLIGHAPGLNGLSNCCIGQFDQPGGSTKRIAQGACDALIAIVRNPRVGDLPVGPRLQSVVHVGAGTAQGNLVYSVQCRRQTGRMTASYDAARRWW